MNDRTSLLFMLFLLVMMPVLDISGHFINLAEFYLYGAFSLNVKKIKKTPMAFPFIVYLVLFFLTTLLTAALAGEALNNYDIFVLRNMGQMVVGLMLFHTHLINYKSHSSPEKQHETYLLCFAVLTIPSVVVFLQSINVFNMRFVVQWLYKPQFFFLKAEDFSSFRYTSVFKDFFTSAVYYIVLCGSLFYYYLRTNIEPLKKLPLLFLIGINYAAQLFVSRTSLVGIPILILFLLLFGPAPSLVYRAKRVFMTLVFILPLMGVILYVVASNGLVNLDWAMEGINLFSDEKTASASFAVMNIWVMNFVNYIKDNPFLLLKPKHVYDLTESSHPFLYSDSFYPQEIYRYGIYGILIYLLFVLGLLRNITKKSKGLGLLILSLVVLNYKGGNTFFMPKNIYMYAFVFALLFNYHPESVEVEK